MKPIRTDLVRGAADDNRRWCGLGIVSVFDGESSHYIIDEKTNDIFVTVLTIPEGDEVEARLGVYGSPDEGMVRIPSIGTEVALIWNDGQPDSEPVVVGSFFGGPKAVDVDVDEETVLIKASRIVIKTTSKDITISTVSGKKVILQNGTLDIARKTDSIDAGQLNGIAGPYPVNFTHFDPKTSAITSGPTVNLTGEITGGNPDIKG